MTEYLISQGPPSPMHGAEGVGELADLSLLIDAQRVAIILGWVKAVFDTVEVDLGVETGDS